MQDQVAGISLAAVLHLVIAIPVCGHILLNKEQESAAVAWIGVVLLSPFLGPLLYWLFGINRIQRRARRLHKRNAMRPRYPAIWESLTRPVPAEAQLLHLGEAIHEVPFLLGNAVTPLVNGDAAYPQMLAAIAAAETSIALSSYIFDYDAAGTRFVEALIAAEQRGVTVRVLLDDFGTWYSPRSISRMFKGTGVRTARFLSGRLRDLPFLNLRNHRKLLVIDGKVGFIGGMNIRAGNLLNENPRSPVHDIHFRVEGPVLDQMSLVFENDWTFASGEPANLPAWDGAARESKAATAIRARVITNGPDEALDKLQLLLMGALATCRTRVAIMTPYFLPNETLVSALEVAALRGVDVELVLPEYSNIPPMAWAMQAMWAPLVMHGVRITVTPLPFDHSKVMIVDGTWVLVGSTNWDQRSLRLNFEANLECYDPELGASLEAYIAGKRARGRRVTRKEVMAASLPIQLRNRFVRLFASYL